MKKIYYLLLVVLLSNCASFLKSEFKNDYKYMSVNDLKGLNGRYELHPNKRYVKQDYFVPKDSLKHIDLYSRITNEFWREYINSRHLKPLGSNYYVELDLEEDNMLLVKLFRGDEIIKQEYIEGKLKKGMFYLNNKYIDIQKVPYIFGGVEISKRRIGITKSGQLIVNTAVVNEGAFLLIIGSGYRYNSSYEFIRIVKN